MTRLRDKAQQLSVQVIEGAGAQWDDWLAGVSRDIYQGAGYHDFARGCGEGLPHLVVVRDRERGFAWPYLLRSVGDLSGLAGSEATDVGSVYGYPGPVAWGCEAGDDFLEQAWSEVVGVWREQGAVTAFTRFHPLLDNAALVASIAWPGANLGHDDPVVIIGPTVSVDCTLSDEVASAGYARALRQHIRAGREAGLVTTYDERWTALPTFTELYRQTMARNGASDYYFFDQDYFERLRASLPGQLHLLVTSLGDTIGAAGIFTEFDGIVQSHLVGTNADLRAHSPFKVLLDDVRRWARMRGNHTLHLGGGRGGRADSLLRFKGEFSPRRHPFATGRWILEPGAYRELTESRRAAGVQDRKQIDPSYFPAYRAPLLGQASAASVHTDVVDVTHRDRARV